MANIPFKSITFPGLPNKYTVPEISNDLMTAGKAADAKATGDALSALEDQFTEETDKLKADLGDKLDAYLNVDFSIDNKRVNSLGSIVVSNGQYITDYYPCSEGTVVKWHGKSFIYGGASVMCLIAFFDADKAFITGITSVSGETTSVIGDVSAIAPAGTAYVVGSTTIYASVANCYLHVYDANIARMQNEIHEAYINVDQLKADLEDLQEEIEGGGTGMSQEFKTALHNILEKVAYIDEDGGQDYLDALDRALWPPKPATGISLNQSSLSFGTLGVTQQLTATVIPSDSSDRVVWTSSNPSVATVSNTGLVTSVAYGSATITATAGSVSATCSVTIAQVTLTSIDALYTQSGTVYDTDSIDTLKTDLVVTAHWSDSSTSTVPSTDYTLSGTLIAETSTITVAYGDKTTTFTVTVSATGSAISVPLTIERTIIDMATGATSGNNSWYASDFIELPSGMTKMKYSNGTGINILFRGAFYDSSNSYVSSSLSNPWIVANGATGTVNIPSTAKYIRLSTNSSPIINTTITLMASAI